FNPAGIVGSTITVFGNGGNNDNGFCNSDVPPNNMTITSLVIRVEHTDGTEFSPNLLSAPILLPLGQNTPNVQFSSTLHAGDGGASVSNVGSIECGIHVLGFATLSNNVHQAFSADCISPVDILTPCLKVTKLVACRPPDGNCTNAT